MGGEGGGEQILTKEWGKGRGAWVELLFVVWEALESVGGGVVIGCWLDDIVKGGLSDSGQWYRELKEGSEIAVPVVLGCEIYGRWLKERRGKEREPFGCSR